MIDKQAFGALSLLCGTLGYGFYLWSIAMRRTRPHAFSWIIWGTVTFIVFYAQISEDAGAGAWATGFSSGICFLVALLAFCRGEKNITTTDWLTFLGALLAIPVWLLTRNPLGSVILVTLIDMLGFYPTFRKSYAKPYEESVGMYTIDSFKYAAALLALDQFSWVTAFYPAAVILSNVCFIFMVLARRKSLPKKGL